MTQDEIIEIGVQAGIHREVLMLGRNLKLLTDFANLVAEKAVRESSAEYRLGWNDGQIAEREACAKLVDYWEAREGEHADAIRARGEA